MSKLKIGVIGLGMGVGHIEGFRSHPQAEVVAVADTDAARLEERGRQKFGIENLYTDAMTMIKKEKLDVISIATPNKFHKPLTIAALKAGCHVLCEKPMAMNAREGQAMIDAAEKAGKRLMINFSYRFRGPSQALKRLVDTGILGDVYFARTIWHRRRGLPGFGGWFGQKELAGGGPLIDLGVHRLDLALWLMGYPKPVWVMGSTYNHIASELAKKQRKKFDVEDLAAGMIRFENGATMIVEASWAANIRDNEEMETRLCGTRAGLVQRNVGGGYEFESEVYLEQGGSQCDMKLRPNHEDNHSSMYCFVDAIINDKPTPATAQEGLTVMKLLDAIYLSAARQKPVELK